MAFVSIDNPDGINHHGGNMAWCRISNTRAAILTFTKDNKALIQEVNYVGGNTVIGTPTFLKQVTPPGGAMLYFHMRSFVRVLSADRLFVILPTGFSNLVTGGLVDTTTIFTGSTYYTGMTTQIGTPTSYTCMTLQRNADGTYTVDSSIDINMLARSVGGQRDTRCSPIDIDISANSITIYQYLRTISGMRAQVYSLLTMVDGKITAQQGNQTVSLSGNSRYSCVMDSREKLTPTGETVRKYMLLDSSSDTATFYVALGGATAQILCENARVAISEASFPAVAWSTTLGYALCTAAWLPIDKAAKSYVYLGGTNRYSNGIQTNTLNDSWIDAGQEVQYPLDAAWVTNNLACIVGQAGAPGTNGNPTGGPFLFLAGDMAFAQHPDFFVLGKGYGTYVRQLCMSFRNVMNTGIYAGPLDAIRTQYYTLDGKNTGNMIHRIDDTAFWLIGCFRDGIDGEDKLGVITVKA